MRIGIYPSIADRQGRLHDAAAFAERARMIEAADLDGIWLGDHLTPRDPSLIGQPDTLTLLPVAAAATPRIELGTNIFCIPTRNEYDVVQRFYTLEMLFPRRFTLGVSTGSQRHEYEASAVEWDERFHLFHQKIATIRALCERPLEGVVGIADRSMVGSFSQIAGLPRLVLGAWHSDRQLRRAATEYDGWMTSGFLGLEGVGWKKSFAETIKRYRDLGGRRAMISTVFLDLRQPSRPIQDDEAFNLFCPPGEASERLNYLAELGFDDIIVNWTDSTSRFRQGPHVHDFKMDDLEEVRSLLPKSSPVFEPITRPPA